VGRLRISHPAQADLEAILAVSLERWGDDGLARYGALIECNPCTIGVGLRQQAA
jgi:hypothetical protein